MGFWPKKAPNAKHWELFYSKSFGPCSGSISFCFEFFFFKKPSFVSQIITATNIRAKPERSFGVSFSWFISTENAAPKTDSRVRIIAAVDGGVCFCPKV